MTNSCSLLEEDNSADLSLSLSINSRSIGVEDIDRIVLTVTGAGMSPIVKETTSNTLRLSVEYGSDRRFEIDLTLCDGREYNGSTTIDINGSTRSVPMTLNYALEFSFEFDIISANSPVTVNKSGKDIVIQDEQLYLGVWKSGDENQSGVYIYDITNRGNPIYDTTAVLWADALSIDINNNHLYAANGARNLRTFNINTPSNPILLDENDTDDGSFPETMGLSSDSSTIKTISQDNSVYLLSYADNYIAGEFQAGASFIQFDVTEPNNPDKSIYYSVGEAMPKSFCLDDSYAYVVGRHLDIFDINNQVGARESHTTLLDSSETAYDVVKSGDYLYIVTSNKLIVVDVSNPLESEEVYAFNLDGNAISDGCPSSGKALVKSGNYLYIADGSAGIVILDVTDPLVPTLKNSIVAETNQYFRDIYFYESKLYTVVEKTSEMNSISYLNSYNLELQ
ncbi:MAG: hypothetical protein OCD02_22530 [Spirochaetaceae bacterium]